MPLTLGQNSLSFDWHNIEKNSPARFIFLGAYQPHLTRSETGYICSINDREIDVPKRFKRTFERIAQIGNATLQELAVLADSDGVPFEELVSFMMILHENGVVGTASYSD